jgi:hypothetical protein
MEDIAIGKTVGGFALMLLGSGLAAPAATMALTVAGSQEHSAQAVAVYSAGVAVVGMAAVIGGYVLLKKGLNP